MDPVSYDFTNNFGKMPQLVALLRIYLQQGEMARNVIHCIVGCLATSVANVPERWIQSIKQYKCHNKYITTFGHDPFYIFKLLDLSHYLLDDPRRSKPL